MARPAFAPDSHASASVADRARLKRLSTEGTWLAIGQLANILGALVLVRLLTEYLKPATYGELALGMTLAGVVNQVLMGGVAAGIARYYSIAAQEGDLRGYLSASRRLLGYCALAVSGMGLALSCALVLAGKVEWISFLAVLVLFSILSGVNVSLGGIQNAARQRSVVALHAGFDAWLKVALALILIMVLGASSLAVVMGYVIAAFFLATSQWLFLGRVLRSDTGPYVSQAGWVQRIWSYSLPFSTWGAFTWAQQASDRWALNAFATTDDVGRYAVLFQLGYAPIGILTGLSMSFLGPILYQRAGAATDLARNASVHRLVCRITGLSLAVTALSFTVALFLHQQIFELAVAGPFRGLSHLFPWVVLAGGVFAAGQILALKLMSELRASRMTRAKIVSALLGIFFNMLGAAYFGIRGVVVAIVAFSTLYFAWMTWLAISSDNPEVRVTS